MENHYRNFSNAYYNHDNYSQAYQEYDQHTHQPETGQTSGRVAASGPSQSYPAPDQTQPYLDLNFPPWIPPSPSLGRDSEYLLPPQPTPLENIIQNDVLSYAQSAVNPQDRKVFTTHKLFRGNSTKARILEGLEAYASGTPLNECSATIRFSTYFSTDGCLSLAGRSLYNRLEQGDKDRVINALQTRRRMAAEQISGDLPHFLAALEPYSNGIDLLECGRQSGLKKKAAMYLTSEGGLTSKGKLLIENLSPEQQTYVSNMLEQRRQHEE
jgi:hypothetical protein